ncbi:MAG: hypothetical protein IPP57_06105 [Candidatus Obscuribacter sp.]|nr:hypothetical protein [Candidatus Obscuribacter sp.]
MNAKKISWLNSLVALPLLITMACDVLSRSFDLSSGLAMRLAEAQRMATGQLPYLDFFSLESNFALYLSGLPLAFNQFLYKSFHLFVPLTFLAKSLILSLLVLSLLVSLLILRKSANGDLYRYFAICFLLGNYLVRFEFGELQHLFLLFALPFMLARWLTYQSMPVKSWLMVLSAFMALCGVLLDPYFLLTWLVFELVLTLYYGRCAYASALVFGALALFGTLMPLFGSKVMVAYQGWILPLRLAKLAVFDPALLRPGCVPDRRDVILLGVFALMLLFLRIKKQSYLVVPAVLLLMGFGQYILECEGLSLTLTWTMACAAFIVLAVLLDTFKSNTRALTVVSLVVSLAGSLLLYQNSVRQIDAALAAPVDYIKEGLPDIAQVIDIYSKPSDQVLILSDFAGATYPLLNNYDRNQAGYMTYGKPLHLLRMLTEKNKLSPALVQYKKYVESKFTQDLLQGKQTLLIVHLNHELEDMLAIPEVAAIFERNYDLLYKCYFYTNRREPKEMAGLFYPFYVYMPNHSGAP